VRDEQGDPGRPATQWRFVHIEASIGPGASLALSVRWASDVELLADAPWEAMGTLDGTSTSRADGGQSLRFPATFDAREGGAIELGLTLRSSFASGAPVVRRVGVEWLCPGPA
jgi:hypothetical protein